MKPLQLSKPLVCRLFLHQEPSYTREDDDTASWQCGTETCGRRWRRFEQDGTWKPEHEREVREAQAILGIGPRER